MQVIEHPDDPDLFRTSNDTYICWWCKEPADWISLTWEAPICSVQCNRYSWLAYLTDNNLAYLRHKYYESTGKHNDEIFKDETDGKF